MDDFGETLVGKKRPAVFIFNLLENTISEVLGIEAGIFAAFPIFDETNKGIIYSGIKSPVMKMGMNFCLNRDTKLYHIREPVFDKKNLPAEGGYVKCLNPTEFMAVTPKFSDDYSKLLYIGAKEKFISHSGNFEIRYLKWPPTDDVESVCVVGRRAGYPTAEDDFAGLYGYNQSLISTNFLGTQSRFAAFESPFKAQHRVYLVDTDTKELKWFDFLNKKSLHGDYEL